MPGILEAAASSSAIARLDVVLAALAPGVEERGQLAEALGLEDLEREVLELPLDLPDPEPLGERGVDLHGLAGDPLLLLATAGRTGSACCGAGRRA